MDKMKKIRVLFRWSGYNHYTLSALIGLLDERLSSRKFEIDTVDSLKGIVRASKDAAAATVIAYSFATPQFAKVKTEIKKVRRALGSKVIIICGGPHTSALPESALTAGADIAFVGESEESLPCFLEALYRSKDQALKNRIITPLPLKHLDSYPPFAHKRRFYAPIEIRRGCRNRCSFCQTPGIFQDIKERTPGCVIRYADILKKTGGERILFTAPDALSYGAKGGGVDIKIITKLLNEIHKIGIAINFGNFPSEISPNRLVRSPEAASVLKRYVRNSGIFLGGQSASGRILRSMRRDHTVQDTVDAVRILRNAGFTPIVDILLGFPAETRLERLKTMRFIASLAKQYRARFNLHYFIPLPGTPLYGAKPEPIKDDIKNALLRLIRSGTATGDFFGQLKLANRHPAGSF
ncbi:TIGR04013 family B12-binding domain/radical SAM domain-containing protein [Candidatus Omnitrophota bacterium]